MTRLRNIARRHECSFTCTHTNCSGISSVTKEIPNFRYMLLISPISLFLVFNMCMYCWYDNLFCIYGVILLLLVKWNFRMVSPRNLSSYHSQGEDIADHFSIVVYLVCWCQLRMVYQRMFRNCW